MDKPNLGTLQRVDLREVWDNEAGSFTPWLAQEGNIRLLGDAIGLELEVQSLERDVGPFRADLVCKDLNSDKTVLIENQIETTDHNHLGQLLTYAAGLDAAVVVWLAKEFAPEHRAAVDWINEKMAGNAHFFGVEVEVLRIGNSDPAPRFNVVCRPNDWQEMVRLETGGLSDSERLRLEYWTAVGGLLKRRKSPLRMTKAASNTWQGLRTPVRGYGFGLWMSLRDKWITVYLSSNDSKSRAKLKALFTRKKKTLEADLGVELEFFTSPSRTLCSINSGIEADPQAREDWHRQHEWLIKTGENFARVFPRYL